ncbi:MAG: TIGR01777 family oxidoreductase [Candidatus Eisenbacteria bacterium]
MAAELKTTQKLPISAAAARAWFARPEAASRLVPPWGAPAPPLVREFGADGDGCVVETRAAARPGAAAALAWAARVAGQDLARPLPRLRVGVTGASGMIGRALAGWLALQGAEPVRFVRASNVRGAIPWDPARGTLDPAALEGLDAVIHLAGAGIADRRWTAERKRTLVESRVAATGLLARAVASAAASGRGPRVLVSASAIGAYGDRGDETLADDAGYGQGFLAGLAREWEGAAAPAAAAGVRVAHPRIGVVLWPSGGALAKLLPPARLGAGGPLGSGAQWWSWVTLHDVLDMLVFPLQSGLRGAYNAVAPAPERQRAFAAALGRVLGRPAFAPAPAFALRLALGEMADEALLASQRVEPRALAAAGYRHRDAALEPALRALLGRTTEGVA